LLNQKKGISCGAHSSLVQSFSPSSRWLSRTVTSCRHMPLSTEALREVRVVPSHSTPLLHASVRISPRRSTSAGQSTVERAAQAELRHARRHHRSLSRAAELECRRIRLPPCCPPPHALGLLSQRHRSRSPPSHFLPLFSRRSELQRRSPTKARAPSKSSPVQLVLGSRRTPPPFQADSHPSPCRSCPSRVLR
jgi:hypothetical protein